MNKVNKILVLVPHLRGNGGVASYYNNLMLERICNIQYFAVNTAKPQSPFFVFFRLIFNYILFVFIIIVRKYLFIHLNPSLDHKSFYRDAVFIIFSKILNNKVLVFFHGWLDDYEHEIKVSKIKSFLFKMSFAKADKFIVLGQVFKNKLLQMGVPESKEFFIETTVADSRYLNELYLDKKICTYQNTIVILFLSRILRSKGIYITLEAFKIFSKRIPDRNAILIIAGDGPELSAARKFVDEEHIDNVQFTGNIISDEKMAVLLKSHIMLCPSYSEGMPLSILEGMLYGMPIITRNTGAIPDIIEHGENGFLSKSLDPNVYADFLYSIVSNYDLYKKIAMNNHRKALLNYSTEKVGERLIKIYKGFTT